jgi:hypothetical protein
MDHHFSLFDIEKKKITGTILKSGRKKEESLGFLSHGLYDNQLWVHDIVKDEIITAPINASGVIDSLSSGEINNFYYSIAPLSTGSYLVSGDYDSSSRVSILNFEAAQINESIVDYPINMSRGQKMLFESFLFTNPSRNKAALAARYCDRVQFVDLITNKTTTIKGPENFEPDFDIKKGSDNKEIIFANDKSRYGFLKGFTTDKYLYLLYSGEKLDGPNLYFGKYIYVYDWEGQPVKKIELSDHILDFVVTSDNTKLYTYNPLTKNIEYSKLRI